jgi:cytochrome c2
MACCWRTAKPGQPARVDGGGNSAVSRQTWGQSLAHKLGNDAINRRAKAGAAVAARCQQCHYPDRAASAEAAGGLIDVLPASVPAQWLAHGRFDHSSHRHVECRTCHAAAQPAAQGTTARSATRITDEIQPRKASRSQGPPWEPATPRLPPRPPVHRRRISWPILRRRNRNGPISSALVSVPPLAATAMSAGRGRSRSASAPGSSVHVRA